MNREGCEGREGIADSILFLKLFCSLNLIIFHAASFFSFASFAPFAIKNPGFPLFSRDFAFLVINKNQHFSS